MGEYIIGNLDKACSVPGCKRKQFETSGLCFQHLGFDLYLELKAIGRDGEAEAIQAIRQLFGKR